ncbi:terminase large subunit domain-containing protein [Paenibacillus radicis (ex Xue et al. 2023)]|uniref:DNA packaging protein n=1 Tax=Paenibacillus radicis (ex Xue et al. 2023) TaxID=2972489 RepID=A0ABT1YKH7_9BACL|nr:terminase family protein [Paenibacillus radicis (ex Xue et al. 2023)]MCR8633477.1 DNA packaging protein [Paenibacillus radicis (ex Xue et al. 2023)]
MLHKIHEQIRKAAEAINVSEESELKYIELAGEINRKLKAEFRDDSKALKKFKGNLDNFEAFCFEYLRIKTKTGDIVPLTLNNAQKKLAWTVFDQIKKGKPVRIIILKARQMGFSTTTEAIIYYLSSLQEAKNAFIVAQDSSASENLYDMFRLYYDYIPENIKPMRKRNNSRRLTFENPALKDVERKKEPGLKSKITVQSAENRVLARSETIHYLHISELAFWPENRKKKHLASLFAALSKEPRTVGIIESTANGIEIYKEMWDNAVAGKNDYIPLFFPWFEMPDYRMKVPADFDLTKEEIELKEKFNLNDEQLEWRRYTIRNDFEGDEKLFRQEYPSTPEEAFLVTGRTVFNQDKLDAMSKHTIKGKRYSIVIPPSLEGVGYDWTTVRFIEDERGELEIFNEFDPDKEYCIGADVAEGLEGGDGSAAYIIDADTGEDAAALYGQMDLDIYAKQLDYIGRMFGDALLGVESNNVGHSVINTLLNVTFYPNLYHHDSYNAEAGKNEAKPGWPTTVVTRPILVDSLIEGIREGVWRINDVNLIGEMKTFVRNKAGKPQAMGKGTLGGCKDDRVLGYGIAHQMRLRRPPSTKHIMIPSIGSVTIKR